VLTATATVPATAELPPPLPPGTATAGAANDPCGLQEPFLQQVPLLAPFLLPLPSLSRLHFYGRRYDDFNCIPIAAFRIVLAFGAPSAPTDFE